MELQVTSLLTFFVTISLVSGNQLVRRREINMRTNTREIELNNTMASLNRHKTLINLYSPRSYRPYEILAVYNDIRCKPCLSCMERAIRARIDALKNEPKHDSVELHNDIIASVVGENKIREKRTANDKEQKEKKPKPKKIGVTRYTHNGNVTVIKVKETTLDDSQSNCDVYSIVKSFSCQSPEGKSLLASVKKNKSNKRDKKQTSTKKITSALKKRDTSHLSFDNDNSQVPENVWPSFEEYF